MSRRVCVIICGCVRESLTKRRGTAQAAQLPTTPIRVRRQGVVELVAVSSSMPVDYSKFDSIGDDDDQLVDQLKKEQERQKPENGASTHYARGLLSDRLLSGITDEMHPKDDRESKIELSGEQRQALLHFIAVQQHGSEADNTPRATAIQDFMLSGKAPKTSVLLALMWAVEKRIEESGRPTAETEPIWSMLLGALNTLLACAKKDSAQSLFETMKRSPDGAFAKKYRALEFGRTRYEKYRMAALHEETRWKYGDAVPWRKYAPPWLQDQYDAFWTLPEWQRMAALGAFGFTLLTINPLLVSLGLAEHTPPPTPDGAIGGG